MIVGIKLTLLGLRQILYGGVTETPDLTKVENLRPDLVRTADLVPRLTIRQMLYGGATETPDLTKVENLRPDPVRAADLVPRITIAEED